jgi:hypothetical protein
VRRMLLRTCTLGRACRVRRIVSNRTSLTCSALGGEQFRLAGVPLAHEHSGAAAGYEERLAEQMRNLPALTVTDELAIPTIRRRSVTARKVT